MTQIQKHKEKKESKTSQVTIVIHSAMHVGEQ